MKKRHFLQLGGATVGAIGFAKLPRIALSRFLPSKATEQTASQTGAHGAGTFPVTKTEAEWRKILSTEEFEVLRQHGTERPYSSALNDEKRAGIFHCAGCGEPLYDSETKFNSGTGWPSFYEAIQDSVGYSVDHSFMMVRTEVHCATCGGHLGHVFDDGPKPTGKRHCINGVSLKFEVA